MAILPVLTFPNDVLRRPSSPAEPGTGEVRVLAENMVETMYAAPGIGLAAPQVGLNIRLVVVDVTAVIGEPEPHVLLNPEITQSEEVIAFEEGCLSLPELSVEIERARKIEVQFQDLDGNRKSMEAENLLAVAIQHEMDHLEGKLILDYASAVRRDLYRRKARKMRAQGG